MFDSGTYGSRSLYGAGNAVLGAARQAKKQLLERASEELNAAPEELEVRNRRVYVRTTPERSMPIADVVTNATFNSVGQCLDITGVYTWSTLNQSANFNATFAEVEVDTETGEVKVIKVVIAHDIGRAINPAIVEGQLEGGAVQGIGYTLTENFVVDMDTGICLSNNFETYRIPTSLDSPEIEVILVERPVPSGPFGAKGVGEAGGVGMAAAIANAIYNAVGVRIKELPITPEKILKALKAK
jgi:xanthine dehydrogenase molybdenum-binding subunit